MLKKTFIFLYFAIIFFDCNAQIFQRRFNKIGGADDYGGNCVKSSSGGYYISGSISNPPNYIDGVVIKFNSNGDTLWTKIYGGPSSDGYGILNFNNQSYVLGNTGFPSFGQYDIVLAKINPLNGDTLWTKRYGTTQSDQGQGPPIKTIDDGFLITGIRNTLPNPPWNWILIKTDSVGDTLWTKEYDGGNDESSFSILQTITGEYILCGATNSFGAGDYDIMVCKLDANGNPLVCKTFGGSLVDAFNAIKPCQGGYIIQGITKNWGSGNADAMLIKIDTNLNIIWAKAYGTSTDDEGYSLEVTSNGDFVIAGRIGLTTSSIWDVYLIKTDSSGNLIWSKKYSPSIDTDWANYVIETTDLGYLLAGSSYSSTSGYDIYVIKTDSSGNSGCNQANVTTITTDITSLLTVGTGALTVSNPGLIIDYAPINISSGLQMNTLCYTGIEENSIGSDISIYPNPSPGIFTVSSSEIISQIEIYNPLGELIFSSQQLTTINYQLDFSTQPKGIYFIKIIAEDKIHTQKIIIQ